MCYIFLAERDNLRNVGDGKHWNFCRTKLFMDRTEIMNILICLVPANLGCNTR